MEQNSEPMPTSKGQYQAQNVVSTLSSQTTKLMKNFEAVLETVLMMKDLETDPRGLPLIKRSRIMLKKISDLEIDLQCLPRNKRATIVRDRIIGQNVSGSATYSQHDCRIGEQININYSDLMIKNLEAVLMMKDLETDHQSIPSTKRCMILLKRISDLEMDLQCLPIKKRDMIVRNSIIDQDVSGYATCSHHDRRIGKQINIYSPISVNQQESNLQRHAAGKQPSVDNHQYSNDGLIHLAVYSPADSAFDGTDSQPSQNQAYRIAPSVAAFTAQCSLCSKWRLLPSKQKFEEINEHILEQPFICVDVREWDPEKSCSDDPDLTQDGRFLWAIERPNIPRPPLGWERLVRFRGFRGARFADVYYIPPSGKRLRSTVEVQRYLLEHPDKAAGVDLSRFSFQPPKPLWENFVKKGTDHVASPDGSVDGTLKSSQESPLSRMHPEANTELQLGRVNYAAPYHFPVVEPTDCPAAPCQAPLFKSIDRPTKRSKK